jgi:5'-3' exonuclease
VKVLIDHMNFLFISFHMARKELHDRGIEEFTEEHVGFFYHTLFNKYNHLFKTYGQAIICHEGMDSLKWRRDIYPDYKRNRDEGKKDPSYLVLKNTFNKIEEVLSYYPCKQIKVDNAEADDVIFALAKFYGEQGEDVVIITTDGDLAQAMNYSDTISVYNPIKKVFIQKKEHLIEYKAIVGDRSDNIPGINRIGEKTFEKMLNDQKVWNEKMKGDNYDIYQKFLKIVDLSKFPKEIHAEIIQANNIVDYNIFDIGKIEYFFFENAMQDHISRWGNDSGEIIAKLVEQGVKVKGFMENPTKIDSKQIANSTDEELDDILSEFI